ncbi:MAG: UDP-glucose 4-epimerase GalE, partial [Proteobacteria bacterium]|nr:UDP-glucose 4-epimerase GalE [Pseudomonadota bacterium]
GESVEDPHAYYRNNCVGSLSVLNAMRKAGVTRLLFSSTCATYGTPLTIPIDESHPQSPINPYGWSKLIVERMISDHVAAYGLGAVMLRYFNAAGADLDGLIGERHEPETHAIPLAIRSAISGAPFRIFGRDFDTRDGTAIRDYVHVDDLADAHLRALTYLTEHDEVAAFNLGTGEGTSVLDIVHAVERASGKPLRYAVTGRRAGDPPVLVAAADKARDILGWRTKYSKIDDIVASAWRWHTRGDRSY